MSSRKGIVQIVDSDTWTEPVFVGGGKYVDIFVEKTSTIDGVVTLQRRDKTPTNTPDLNWQNVATYTGVVEAQTSFLSVIGYEYRIGVAAGDAITNAGFIRVRLVPGCHV